MLFFIELYGNFKINIIHPNSMEKMLISGGNGFLGSHLADKAISEGIDVTVIDDFSTSNRINLSSDTRIIRERVEDANITGNFDCIVHLAARPSPEDYINNPVETLMSNSVGTMKLLDISRRGKSRFIYASSSEVYGNAEILPTPETYYGYVSSSGIRSCYDEGKRYSEALTMAYHRKYGLDIRIQRPFNVYGPRIRPDGLYGRVVPRFMEQALKNDDITIHGNGMQTRSFLFVDDWLDATWRLINMDGIDGEIFNIGSPDEITILDLAYTIVKMAKSSSKIVHIEERTDDPKRRSADISKASTMLGWKPNTDLNDGLSETMEWLKGEMQ